MKYITTPIYYVNDIPHIGHAYTTFLSDIFKKSYEIRGQDSYLLTGSDEHGQKIENSAKALNKTPKAYADEVSAKFRDLWDSFNIDYDYFVRTTDISHEQGVQWAFAKMLENGDIYKGYYEGYYCVSCEAFFTQRQLEDSLKCPDCGKPISPLKEESYFFSLSKYSQKLLDFYNNNDVIYPSYRKNEVIKFIEGGLSDLSITRSSFEWGIKLPECANDNSHIIYVWLDALFSYITPLGYGSDNAKMSYAEDMTHFVGKDILRFHAVYWVAFLMSLDLPLPNRIFAHGWWTIDGVKMSKSLGNVVNPGEVTNIYGVEVLRYFLVREASFGADGDFSTKSLVQRANAELSDTLGNLLNRLVVMCDKYFALHINSNDLQYFKSQIDKVDKILDSLPAFMQNMTLNRYLEELWKIFDIGNVSIAKYTPWELMKQNKNHEVASLLVFLANILAKGAMCLYPVIPESSKKILNALGLSLADYEKLISKREYIYEFRLSKVDVLFPKLQATSEIKCENNNQNDKSNTISNLTINNQKEIVKINDFNKLDIRVGEIIEVINIKGSEKLLKFLIDFGDNIGKREIISGIAKSYSPSDLLGVKVCAVVNLKPSKIFGNMSYGMILTSEDSSGNCKVLSVDSSVENGSTIG